MAGSRVDSLVIASVAAQYTLLLCLLSFPLFLPLLLNYSTNGRYVQRYLEVGGGSMVTGNP